MIDIPPPSETSISEISTRRKTVLRRIEAACVRAGRDPEAVRLIAVTKGFPIEVVRAAVAAGCTDFGENRVQELEEKASLVPGEVSAGEIRWHLVGTLQRNKAKRAAELADTFHALDSVRLARTLDHRAAAAERVIPCYVQVNVSGEETKSGIDPAQLPEFMTDISPFEHLSIVGLMTIAAPAGSSRDLEVIVRPQLRLLADLAGRCEDDLGRPLRLSMGMSGDFEIAIEEGATDIRLGTALFGPRATRPE